MFRPDSLVGRFLGHLLDQMIVSLLCIVCCIPVVTAGPSLTALYTAEFHLLEGEEGVIANFFGEWRSSFKRSFLCGGLTILLLAFLGAALYFLNQKSFAGIGLNLCLALMILLVVMSSLWLFPLISRYEETVGKTIRNAFLLSFAHFPVTLLMILSRLILVGIFLVLPKNALLGYVGFVVFFCPGLCSLLDCLLLRRIFKQYPSDDVE